VIARENTSSHVHVRKRPGLIETFDLYSGPVRVAIVRRAGGRLELVAGEADLVAVAGIIAAADRPRLRGGLD